MTDISPASTPFLENFRKKTTEFLSHLFFHRRFPGSKEFDIGSISQGFIGDGIDGNGLLQKPIEELPRLRPVRRLKRKVNSSR